MIRKVSLQRLRIRHLLLMFIASLNFVLLMTISFYWFSTHQADLVMIERLESQELGMARSASLSLTEFFKARKKELAFLSELEPIQAGREKESMEILGTLAQGLKEEGVPIGNIIRVNKEGETIWGVNVELGRQDEETIGIQLGGLDCFLWAKEKGKKGEVFLSEPTVVLGGHFKDKRIVSLTTPLFYREEFNGVIVINFLVDDLARKYIEPLSLSSQTYFTVINEEGLVITSTFERLIGQNILQIQEEKNWPKESRLLVQKAIRGEEGAAFHSYINLLTGKTSEAVSAYSPIRINGSLWSFWVSVPYERIKELVLPFRMSQIFILVVVFGGVLLLTVIYVLGLRVSQRDGFLDGYALANGKKSQKKKKK